MLLRLLLLILAPLIEPARLHRRSQFELLPTSSTDLLFIGDSITEFGVWNEWFPPLSTANRGVSGETSEQVLTRLDTLPRSARFVFLLIGTNDLSLRVPEDRIAANVEQIVSSLVAGFPSATIFVQSVMPRRSKWKGRIQSLNARYRRIAADFEVVYVDLWPALAGSKDELREEFSRDGLHLNGAGYRAWVGALSRLLGVESSARSLDQ